MLASPFDACAWIHLHFLHTYENKHNNRPIWKNTNRVSLSFPYFEKKYYVKIKNERARKGI